MKFRIDNQIFDKFPGLHIGVLVARGVHNSDVCADVREKMRCEEERIRDNYNYETFSYNPKIEAWRKAYSAFGGKPKENKSSVESLFRSVLKGMSLRHIINVTSILSSRAW